MQARPPAPSRPSPLGRRRRAAPAPSSGSAAPVVPAAPPPPLPPLPALPLAPAAPVVPAAPLVPPPPFRRPRRHARRCPRHRSRAASAGRAGAAARARAAARTRRAARARAAVRATAARRSAVARAGIGNPRQAAPPSETRKAQSVPLLSCPLLQHMARFCSEKRRRRAGSRPRGDELHGDPQPGLERSPRTPARSTSAIRSCSLNDGADDNWQGEYAVLLANSGGPKLAGIVVNTSPPWPDIDANIAGWRGLVAAARASGLARHPRSDREHRARARSSRERPDRRHGPEPIGRARA